MPEMNTSGSAKSIQSELEASRWARASGVSTAEASSPRMLPTVVQSYSASDRAAHAGEIDLWL